MSEPPEFETTLETVTAHVGGILTLDCNIVKDDEIDLVAEQIKYRWSRSSGDIRPGGGRRSVR